MGENISHVTDATFESTVVNIDKPAMVDFWAVWCGPCRIVAPHVEALAQEFAGKAVVAKLLDSIDTDPIVLQGRDGCGPGDRRRRQEGPEREADRPFVTPCVTKKGGHGETCREQVETIPWNHEPPGSTKEWSW
jgi:thiol-disulfide isomerase/thioredoxin